MEMYNNGGLPPISRNSCSSGLSVDSFDPVSHFIVSKLTIMERLFFTCILIILFTATATVEIFSQEVNNSIKLKIGTKIENNSSPGLPNSLTRVLYRNEVHSTAIRNFLRVYKNASNVNWFRTTPKSFGLNGFRAVFTDGMIKTMVLYDNKGNLHSIMRYYMEDELPQEIRHRIKTIYYDFSICHVKEVTVDNNTIYVVTLEDKISWKVIQVPESGAILVMNSFTKI